jgi:hypothetical protein
VPDTEAILRDVRKRKERSRRRIDLYKAAFDEFFGYFKSGSEVRPMIADGRPIERLQSYRDWLDNRSGAPNFVPIVVEDFKALRGVLPAQKVKPREESEEEHTNAEKWTRVLREQWDHSNMDLQAEEAGFFYSLMGELLYLLEPVFPDEAKERDIPPGIYICVYEPNQVFPKMKQGWERFELESVAISAEMTADDVAERWPAFRQRGDTAVEVVYWYDAYDKVVLAGDQEVHRWTHNLKEVPAVWSRTKQHGGASNQSDVVNILDLNRELGTTFMVMSDGLIMGTYAEKVVINADALPEQIATGPGAVIPVKEGGDVRVLQQTANPQYGSMLMDTTLKYIENVSGASEIRVESGISGSNITGRAIRNSQGGQEQRLAIAQQNLGRAYQMVSAKILRMLYRLKEFHTDITIWGEEKGAVYSFEFNGKELEGWSRTTVEWDASIGTTTHERIVQALQMKAAGAVPRWYIGQQAGLEDPEQMVRLADQDQVEQMKAQAEAQQAMQPQGAQGGGPPQQGGDPSSADPGAAQGQIMQPASQAQQMEQGGAPPGFPPGVGPQSPRGIPAPVPDFDQQVSQLVSGIKDRLRGQIVSVKPDPAGGVRVELTDTKDFPLVKQALAPMGTVRVSLVKTPAAAGNGRTG